MNRRHFLSLSLATAASASCRRKPVAADAPVRFGHFPNITHVQALVASQLSFLGNGWFEKRLGVPVQWFTYNAGPSATEAIFSGSLDVTYIGPSPVLNAYARSAGKEIRILSGAANGGSSIVVRPEAGIKTIMDLKGKRIATPQLGNTQDVQLRALLKENGFTVTQPGGDVTIIPTPNADLTNLFQQGMLDAAWAPEPFASILELKQQAQNLLQDTETNVTMLVSSVAFLKDRPALGAQVTTAHHELTRWVTANPVESRSLLAGALKRLTSREPKPAVLEKALARVVLTNSLSRPSLEKMAHNAIAAGFLKDVPSLDQLLSSMTPPTP